MLGASATLWLGAKVSTVKAELESVIALAPALKHSIAQRKPSEAAATLESMKRHTASARQATQDPVWTMATLLPWLGANLRATTEIAHTADDVTVLGMTPLLEALNTLDWDRLLPSTSGIEVDVLQEASPHLQASAYAVHASSDRLNSIDDAGLLPQIAEPLVRARGQLAIATTALDAAANTATIVPEMMGATAPRNYLLIIQNNAEARASGGIPGALAVLSLDKGKLTLGSQSSAGAVGVMSPTVSLDPEQQQIYSGRMGKFMQDVNLTPDFPTAAKNARTMWERKTGERVDGVISIDPVALGYILDATGPVDLRDPKLVTLASAGLPTQLTGKNVVQTLLSDVYSAIEQPQLQDAYFAGVAKELFAALSDGKGNAKGLFEGLTRATDEGRVLVWSGLPEEQSVLAKYAVSGSIAGLSVAPAQFGVYFNDGTGAKMDYYVKHTVQLVKACPRGGYEEVTLRITSKNTAPKDAATALPAYVTGDGAFGVPPGSVQTNVVAYGPVQAQIELAQVDGKRAGFAPYLHSNRPVGVLAIRLAPGESKTVQYTFGKIVQHTEPNVVVTPTVQPVKDVILPTTSASCD